MDNLRLWKFDPEVSQSTNRAYLWFKKMTNDSRTYQYKLEFDGTFLLKDPEATIDSLCIADDDMLVVENKKMEINHRGKTTWWNL